MHPFFKNIIGGNSGPAVGNQPKIPRGSCPVPSFVSTIHEAAKIRSEQSEATVAYQRECLTYVSQKIQEEVDHLKREGGSSGEVLLPGGMSEESRREVIRSFQQGGWPSAVIIEVKQGFGHPRAPGEYLIFQCATGFLGHVAETSISPMALTDVGTASNGDRTPLVAHGR